MTRDELSIDVVPGEATVAIGLTGEIDFGNVAQMRTALLDASASGSQVVVDLSGVSFIDSMALGVLVQAKRNLEHNGSRLVVRHPTPAVHRVLTVAGLAEYLLG
ncbi:hypothetical protein BH23ACT5_BH23ACT5_08280 [soil metagenome]